MNELKQRTNKMKKKKVAFLAVGTPEQRVIFFSNDDVIVIGLSSHPLESICWANAWIN